MILLRKLVTKLKLGSPSIRRMTETKKRRFNEERRIPGCISVYFVHIDGRNIHIVVHQARGLTIRKAEVEKLV